jgi:hypothetical protein
MDNAILDSLALLDNSEIKGYAVICSIENDWALIVDALRERKRKKM